MVPFVAIFESAGNVLLLILGVMLPIFCVIHSVASDIEAPLSFQFGVPELLNFVIVGGVLVFGFYTNPIFKNNENSSTYP